MSSFFYSGSAASAIELAKERNCLLIVSVEGVNDDCEKMNSTTWKANQVGELLKKHVALQLNWESPDGKNFTSIYPALQLPSIYFITPNGSPVKIVVGYTKEEDLVAAFLDAQKFLQQSEASISSSVTSSNNQQPQQQQQQQQQRQQLQSPGQGQQQNPSSNSGESLSEQAARLREKVHQKREAELRQQQQDAKEREIKRRNEAKAMQSSKQKWEQQQASKEAAQRKKEQSEERMAKEAIRKKIQQDKEERKREREQRQQQQDGGGDQQEQETSPPTRTPVSLEDNEFTSVAFRLFDGSKVVQQFRSDDKFNEAYSFISSELGTSNFIMMSAFPRIVFSEADFQKTFSDLGLVPSATVVITMPQEGTQPTRFSTSAYPASSSATGVVGSYFSSVSSFCYNAIDSVLAFVRSIFTAPPQNIEEENPTEQQGQQNRNVGSSRFGGISQFRNDGDTDSTYNGNSTQQQ